MGRAKCFKARRDDSSIFLVTSLSSLSSLRASFAVEEPSRPQGGRLVAGEVKVKKKKKKEKKERGRPGEPRREKNETNCGRVDYESLCNDSPPSTCS